MAGVQETENGAKIPISIAKSNTEQEDQQEQKFIKMFSQRIIKERTGNFTSLKRSRDGKFIYNSVNSNVTTNRGNKLLQKSEFITRKRLFNPSTLREDMIYYNGSEHNLLHRKKMNFFPSADTKNEDKKDSNDNDNDKDDEFDLHKLVNVRELLTPIQSLSDIVNKPNLFTTFNNPTLRKIILKIILMIEREQISIINYSNLLDVFLGDFPKPLYEENLKLLDYDHNLTLPDDDSNDNSNIDLINDGSNIANTSPTMTNDISKLTTPPDSDDFINTNSNNRIVKDEETQNNGEEDEDEDEDPFFALPKLKEGDGLKLLISEANIEDNNMNNNANEIAEQMEITRQMSQIALQRNEEFIRNLQKIRFHLDKASRIRERILEWSKESAGLQDDDITIPTVLRVVKRGLISATTNKTMIDGENGDEDINETESNTQ